MKVKINNSIDEHLFTLIALFVSALSLLMIGVYLWTKKKFQVHPYNIVSYACLAYSLNNFAHIGLKFIFLFDMPELILWTLGIFKIMILDENDPYKNMNTTESKRL